MNTTTTHVVEGTDLPAYESGLTDSGYLYMGGGVKVTVADRHVEYLRQLVIAAEGAIQRIEARGPKPEPKAEPKSRGQKALENVNLGNPAPGMLARAEAALDYLESEPELQHPGTWLPGDRVLDAGCILTFGHEHFQCEDHGLAAVGYVDFGVDYGSVRITHLVPRENGADR